MSALLEVRGLRAGYDGVAVLHGVDLEVGEGEIVAVLGSNGAGKSTLNNTLSGLLPPLAGTIRFAGVEIAAAPPSRIVAAGLIQVPEGRRVFPNLTVRENLWLGSYRRARRSRAANLERVIQVFPRLGERLGQAAGTLSGGEQQMLAIGRALVTNPFLLILDEATEGLAPLVREEIWRCLGELRAAGQTLLVIDKYIERLVALADRHTIIERGHVAWQGSSAELDADRGLWHRYLGV